MEDKKVLKLSEELDSLSIEERLCFYIDEVGEDLNERWKDMDNSQFEDTLNQIKEYKGEKITNKLKWKQ